MLKKKERLSRTEVADVLYCPYVLRSPLFVAKWKIRTTAEASTQPRFAVVVSAKVCKQAVDRNRKRRQSYEIIRHNIPSMGYPKDVILLGQKPLEKASFKDIESGIISLFTKLFS